jgi:hypothetical protein
MPPEGLYCHPDDNTKPARNINAHGTKMKHREINSYSDN